MGDSQQEGKHPRILGDGGEIFGFLGKNTRIRVPLAAYSQTSSSSCRKFSSYFRGIFFMIVAMRRDFYIAKVRSVALFGAEI